MTSVPMKIMMTVDTDRLTKTRKGRGSEMFASKQGSKLVTQGERNGDTESKKVCVRDQGKTTVTTAEELEKAIASDEVYFVHNGRILRVSEVNGLGHNVIVHAVRRMQGGGNRKAKKSQDTELSSSEMDTVATAVMNQTDPEMMSKLADMSDEETEEALRSIEQAISKQVPSIGRGATESILSELKDSILKRSDETQENIKKVNRAKDKVGDEEEKTSKTINGTTC